VATIWPLLKKLEPETVTLCPADPLAGLNEEITGGPAGGTATVVEVELEPLGAVVVDVALVGDGAGAAALPGVVECAWESAAVVRVEPEPVVDEGVEPPLNETINAMAAATTSAATTATIPINQRSAPLGGGASPDWAGGPVTTGGAGGCPSRRGGTAPVSWGVSCLVVSWGASRLVVSCGGASGLISWRGVRIRASSS
jgi:hypothetical protein